MNHRSLASLVAFALVGSWAGTVFAQNDSDTVIVQQPPAAQPAPVVQTVPAEQERETVSEKGGPSTGMLASGIVVFGISYGTAAIVGLTSDRDSDQHLVVPFAGPWITLADREGCSSGENCDGETFKSVMIGADGVFQAVGGLLVLGAFLNPEERTVSHTSNAGASLHVTPAVGSGLFGLAAFGQF